MVEGTSHGHCPEDGREGEWGLEGKGSSHGGKAGEERQVDVNSLELGGQVLVGSELEGDLAEVEMGLELLGRGELRAIKVDQHIIYSQAGQVQESGRRPGTANHTLEHINSSCSPACHRIKNELMVLIKMRFGDVLGRLLAE